MAHVFISFVHEDQSVASAIQSLVVKELNLQNEVFLSSDRSQVLAGDNWLEKIREALKEAGVVIVLLSRRSVDRPWVNFEAGAAWLADKKVVPCCFGNMKVSKLPHPFTSLNAVQLEDRLQVHYLLTSLHAHLKLTGAAPESPLTKALREAVNPPKLEGLAKVVHALADPYAMLESALKGFTDAPPRKGL